MFSHGGKFKEACWSLLRKALTPFLRVLLSWPNHLPKVKSPNTIKWVTRISTYAFWRKKIFILWQFITGYSIRYTETNKYKSSKIHQWHLLCWCTDYRSWASGARLPSPKFHSAESCESPSECRANSESIADPKRRSSWGRTVAWENSRHKILILEVGWPQWTWNAEHPIKKDDDSWAWKLNAYPIRFWIYLGLVTPFFFHIFLFGNEHAHSITIHNCILQYDLFWCQDSQLERNLDESHLESHSFLI